MSALPTQMFSSVHFIQEVKKQVAATKVGAVFIYRSGGFLRDETRYFKECNHEAK